MTQVSTGRIEVHDRGDGPTLGYLHGILGTPPGLPFLGELARDHRVIAPNLAGFGGSDPGEIRSFADWIWHLSEVIDATGLTGTTVIASSVGAMVATELATIRREAFARLVLLAPLGVWIDDAPVHDLWAERTPRQPEWLVDDPATLAPFAADEPDASTETLMEAEVCRYRTRRSAASIMWPLPERGFVERVHRLTCPAHVIWGRSDRLMDATRYAQRWSDCLPSSAGITFVDGAGHLLEWDQPAAAADAVRRALSSDVAGAR